MKVDADLHLHGKYSGGVSPKMEIPVLAQESSRKGLDLVGTGDILNPKWRKHVEDSVENRGEGIYRCENTNFLLTTEIEDQNRVHHLLFFPSLQAAADAYRDFEQLSSDIRHEGRPRIKAGGETVVDLAEKHDLLVGPAHAFTPYTAIYGKHDSLEEAYGGQADAIDFLELGLSADSDMASKISDHDDLVFLSNSDAHSPWPHRLGREFNRFNLEEVSFSELEKLFQGRRNVELNVGLDPREGKYHCTACNSCHQKYSLEQAVEFDWRCVECGGSIKKGVRDRVNELADTTGNKRPEYLHLPPLANIIQAVVGHSSPTTKTVQEIWSRFNDNHGSEIHILVEEDIDALEKTHVKIASAIQKFRDNETIMVPGGGGDYGELIIPSDAGDRERIEKKRSDELECRYVEKQNTLEAF